MARRHFDIRSQPGFASDRAVLPSSLLYLPIVDAGRLCLQCQRLRHKLGRLVTALVRRGLAQHGCAGRRVAFASLIAVCAATLATIAATMAAIATTRTAPYRGLSFKYAFINQPLMVPEIVTAVALLIVFSRIKVWTGYSGLGYLVAGAYRFLHSLRLSADPRAVGKHGPHAGARGGGPLRHSLDDVPAGDVATCCGPASSPASCLPS